MLVDHVRIGMVQGTGELGGPQGRHWLARVGEILPPVREGGCAVHPTRGPPITPVLERLAAWWVWREKKTSGQLFFSWLRISMQDLIRLSARTQRGHYSKVHFKYKSWSDESSFTMFCALTNMKGMLQAWILESYSEEIQWPWYSLGGIFMACFGSIYPPRGTGHCKLIQSWL